jgi:hypothetical protein
VAIAALIVAIIALLGCWIPYVGVPLPVIGLVLGFLGLRRARAINTGRGLAISGVIISGLALLVALLSTVLVTIILHNHRGILDCGSNNLTPTQQQQCIRTQLGLPSIAPS